MAFLTRLALGKRWLTFVVAAAVTLVSIVAVFQLKLELIPDIKLPMTSVVTVYPGATPDQVAQEVTEPIEGAITALDGLDELSSISTHNMSVVFAEYPFGTNMDAVSDRISRNLDGLQLPPDAESPELYPLNLSMLPVVSLSLAGDISPTELRSIVASQIAPRLEAINGVHKVELVGGEYQAVVALDAGRMNSAGISTVQVAAALSAGQYSSLDHIMETPLIVAAPGNGTPSQLALKDMADVALATAPGKAISRTNGRPSVSISVLKETEANTVSVANAVVDEAEAIQDTLSDGLELHTTFDQSDYIERSIRDLLREAFIGAVLAIIVIFLFLMTFRASLVTALSIPLSILIGFMAMWLWGITINLITLSAMAIAVGRVVDDSIVVLEVIYRRMKEGERFKEAAMNGAREVAAPITSATIATVAIFLPMAFIGGIVGELFRPFALTVTFALMASLLVALVVVPALCGFVVPKKTEERPRDTWYQRLYKPTLKWALGHRALALVIVAVLCIGSFALVPVIGTAFIPSGMEKMVVVEIEMPPGTDLETTARKAAEVEAVIAENTEWEIYATTVGTSSEMGGIAALMGGGSNTAEITALLKSSADQEADVELVRQLLEPMAADTEFTVSAGQQEMMQNSVEITVSGEDSESLNRTAAEVAAVLEGIDGLVNIKNDIADVIPQPQLEIDPARVAQYGLDPGQLAVELGLLMRGGVVSQLNLDGESYEVFVAPVMQGAETLEQLQGLRLGSAQVVTLGDIASIDLALVPTHIRHVDQKRSARITATITEEDIGAVNSKVDQGIDGLTVPPGVEVEVGGVFEEMTEGFRWMGIAIIAAIGISYLIIVLTFRSFLNPFVIMFSLPVASIGALFGLFITGRPLGISAMMGVLMLVGIVLTNAIVLISLVDQLRRRGLSTYDALVEGGSTRLRPILMTAITTMIALVPLALGFGEGTIIAAELATVVIGGLFTSTLLTLIVVPVVYSLAEGLRNRVRRR